MPVVFDPGVFALGVAVGVLGLAHLESSRPMPLPAAHAWLAALADHFKRWPGSHRNRSILVVAAQDVHAAQVPASAASRERHLSIKSA